MQPVKQKPSSVYKLQYAPRCTLRPTILLDKRAYLDARARRQTPPADCITRLDLSQDIVPRINAERFIARMDISKNPDAYAR